MYTLIYLTTFLAAILHLYMTCPYQTGEYNERCEHIRFLETEVLSKGNLKDNQRNLLTSVKNKKVSFARKKDYELRINNLRQGAIAEQLARK